MAQKNNFCVNFTLETYTEAVKKSVPEQSDPLVVLVVNAALCLSGLNINETDKQGYLVVLIQGLPDHISNRIHIVRNVDPLWLSLKTWKRIAVMNLSVDEMSLTCHRALIIEGITIAGIRIAVVAL